MVDGSEVETLSVRSMVDGSELETLTVGLMLQDGSEVEVSPLIYTIIAFNCPESSGTVQISE